MAYDQFQTRLQAEPKIWLDTSTHDSLLEAGQFIATLEHHKGLKSTCPEEITWRNGFITSEQLEKLALPLAKNGYGQYLQRLLSERAPS